MFRNPENRCPFILILNEIQVPFGKESKWTHFGLFIVQTCWGQGSSKQVIAERKTGSWEKMTPEWRRLAEWIRLDHEARRLEGSLVAGGTWGGPPQCSFLPCTLDPTSIPSWKPCPLGMEGKNYVTRDPAWVVSFSVCNRVDVQTLAEWVNTCLWGSLDVLLLALLIIKSMKWYGIVHVK